MLETKKSMHKWWMDRKEELHDAFERGDYTDYQAEAQTAQERLLPAFFAKKEFGNCI